MNIKIQGAETLLFENDKPYTKECDLYISGNIISGIDKEPENFKADKIIKGGRKLVIPGLVNAHSHVYMTLFRNIADDLKFDDWLFGRIYPLEDKLTTDDMYWGTLLGAMEMISTGTTACMDMTIDMEASFRGAIDSGMRIQLSRGLVGEDDNEAGRARLEENLRYVDQMTDKVSVILGPHAPYSCNPGYIKIVLDAAKKHNLAITTHLSESEKEVADVKKLYGMSPVELMEKIGMFDVKTTAAHCVHLSDNDIEILARHNVSVATNPVSNAKLANGFAPLEKLQKAGVNIALGTDGPASNNTINMFRDMNFMSLVHKGKLNDPVVIPAADSIVYATINSAKAMGEDLGRIEVGKKADIAILNTDLPQFWPRNDYIGALCYSANGSEVETVIIDGEIMMENKEFTKLDKEKIYYECQKRIERIR